MDVRELLADIPVFKNISEKEMDAICQRFFPFNYKEGQQVIKEGDLVKEVGIISSGKLTVLMAANNDLIECGCLTKGDFFGSGSLMVGKLSIVNMYSRTHVQGYRLSRKDFIGILNSYPHVKEYFYKSAIASFMRAFEKVNNSLSFSKKNIDNKDESDFFPRTIKKALIYIEKNFMNPLSLDEIAQANAMSRYHFSRIFKTKTGASLKDYINVKRVQRAKYLMENNDMNVTEAAFAVGFNDLSYFSRVFLKLEGVTPSHYKKSFQHVSQVKIKQQSG
ncbi:MAG: helix-turn-helix domain-containing protein [Deltaproteobacteria bacterium]|nr:helix-turn-helix domain-containing protein [Deltaproteobacteria bacterium]